MTPEQNELLTQWNQLESFYKQVKSWEINLRNKVIKSLFGEGKDEGSETIELGGGWKLRCKKPMTYKLGTQADTEAMMDQLSPAAPDDLIKWEPVLSVSSYRLLSESDKRVVDQVLTIKPGQASIEIVPPPKE